MPTPVGMPELHYMRAIYCEGRSPADHSVHTDTTAPSVGTVRSSQRLATKNVFCINPARISISGKIRVFCFDKTGTLTKEGLDFLGALPIIGGLFTKMQSPESAGNTLSSGIVRILASCHAVARFGTAFVGNQVYYMTSA